MHVQTDDNRKLFSVQIASQLDQQFDSTEMRRGRKQFAALLRDGKEVQDYRVLDFFDKVAMYVHSGALNNETAYYQFSYWIERYWIASRNQIRQFQTRENDEGYYADLEEFCAQIRKEERRISGSKTPQAELSETEIRAFLQEEAGMEP